MESEPQPAGGLRSRTVPRPAIHSDAYTRGASIEYPPHTRTAAAAARVRPMLQKRRHHAYTSSKVGGRYHQWELMLLVVFGTLILFALLLVFRIQDISSWSYWSVFTPLFVLDGLIYGFIAWCGYQKWIYHRYIIAQHSMQQQQQQQRRNASEGSGDFWVEDYRQYMSAASAPAQAPGGARPRFPVESPQLDAAKEMDREMERAAQLRMQIIDSEAQPTETYIVGGGGGGGGGVSVESATPAYTPTTGHYYRDTGRPGDEQQQQQEQQRKSIMRHDTFFYRPEFMFYLMLTVTAFVVFQVLLAQHLQSENITHTPLGVVSPLIVWAGVMALALSVRVFGNRRRHDGDGDWWLTDGLYNSMAQRYNNYYYRNASVYSDYSHSEIPVKQRATGMAQQYVQSMANHGGRETSPAPVEVVVEGAQAEPVPLGYDELAQRPVELAVPKDYHNTDAIEGVE